MTTLRQCLDLLERNHVPHVHTSHPSAYRAREVAEAEHLPAYMLAKTIIVRSADGYAMAVIPADCRVGLEELKQTLDLEDVRLATEEEVGDRFPGGDVGAMPPFGILFGVPVFIDVRLAKEKFLFFNAGTHRDAIHMSFADYVRIADPLILRFAHPDQIAAGAGS